MDAGVLSQKISPSTYNLKAGDKISILVVAKHFYFYEFTQVVPGIEVTGIDISQYAIDNAKEEVKDKLHVGSCTKLPFADKTFDFVYSINTFHNLTVDQLEQAVKKW